MTVDQNLLKVFLSIDNLDDLELFFTDMFTPSELEALSLRWKLLTDLNNGLPQRKIAEKYGISLCKITRGSKLLKNRSSFVSKVFRG